MKIIAKWSTEEQSWLLVPEEEKIRNFLRRAYSPKGKRRRLFFKTEEAAKEASKIMRWLHQRNLGLGLDGTITCPDNWDGETLAKVLNNPEFKDLKAK